MNLTALLDVAIGLTLVYLGASLFVTIINEYIAHLLKLRSKQICDSIQTLIVDGDARTRLMQNPALKPFFEKGVPWYKFELAKWYKLKLDGRRPAASYADPKVFAQMLVGAFATDAAADTVTKFRDAVKNLPSPLNAQLVALANTAEGKAENLLNQVSTWFDKSLTMLGEGYKSRMQIISLVVGLGVAVAANIDTVGIVTRLFKDREARDATVAVAVQFAQRTDSTAFNRCLKTSPDALPADTTCTRFVGLVDAVQSRNASLGRLPIGWPLERGAFPRSLLGWALTALALSLGAPFWFDLLNTFVNVRHGMRKPDEKKA